MTIVFAWTAGKRTSSIAARLNVAHKTRGSYKGDRSSDHEDVFSTERGRKRTYKGFQYFCQGHDRETCGTHLFLLDWYLVPHFTLDNYQLFFIEHEANRSGIFAARLMFLKRKETKKLNMIDGSNHAWKSVNNRFDIYRIFKYCKSNRKQYPNGLYGIARSLNCTSKTKRKSRALFSSVDSPR